MRLHTHVQAHMQVSLHVQLLHLQNHNIFTFCFVIILFFIERFFIEDYIQEIQNVIVKYF